VRAVGSGLQVAIGLGLWNLGNYAFFLIAGRVLGPADYGLVAAILSGVLVVQTPVTSLQTALARVVGAYPTERSAPVYRRALLVALRLTPPIALLACGAVALVAALRDDVPVGPLLAAVAILLPVAVFPLALGDLQGTHRFGRYAISMAAFGLPRPLALLALVGVGMGVYAALLGTAATTVVAAAVAVLFTADRLRAAGAAPADPALLRAMRVSLLPLLVGVSAVAVISNLDVIAAKLGLDPVEAGLFASAAVLAKTVFLVPQASTIVLLPRVARRHRAGRPTEELLALSTLAALALGGVATAVTLVAAEPIAVLTFGEEFRDAATILPQLTGAMTLAGVLLTLLYHQVALGSHRVVWVLAAATLALAAGLVAFHESAEQIVAVDAVVAAAALIAHEVVYARRGDTVVGGARALLARRG
jgi:O-antigen/teichoic acid export membrane protein